MTTGGGSNLAVPHDLLPEDGRFGCGPSKVPAAAISRLLASGTSLMGTSHRQPPVRGLVGRVRQGLAELFQLPDGYEVVLGNGGATCFWDVASLGLIEQRSQHLVFGEFSSKFAQVVQEAPHLDSPEMVQTPFGTGPRPHFSETVDCYCLTQNETSTGVSIPVARLGGPEQLIVVDATSAAGGMAVTIAETDAYYFSPQKCLAADGGLWIAILSPMALERAKRLCSSDRWIPAFLNLWTAVENSRLDQTLNTPAIATLFLMAQQVEWLLDQGGLAWAAARCRESSGIIYGWAEASAFARPFVDRADDRSPVVATVDIDEAISAQEISRILRQNGVVDVDSYRKLGRNQLRIGLFPAVEPDDVRRLTKAVDWIVGRLQ